MTTTRAAMVEAVRRAIQRLEVGRSRAERTLNTPASLGTLANALADFDEEIAALTAAAEALEAEAWRPIDTAPLDRDIEVWNAMTGPYVTRHRDGEWPLGLLNGHCGCWYPRPTHWRPLPPPPEAAG